MKLPYTLCVQLDVESRAPHDRAGLGPRQITLALISARLSTDGHTQADNKQKPDKMQVTKLAVLVRVQLKFELQNEQIRLLLGRNVERFG